MSPDSASPLAELGPNSRILVQHILLHGPLSRSDLARRLETSPASLSRLAAPLIGSGLLREVPDIDRRRGSGRPSRPLDVDPDAYRFAGVKLTSDEAYGVITGLRGDLVDHAVRPLPDRSPAGVVAVIKSLVDDLAGDRPPRTIGVSLGGQVKDHRHVSFASFLDWEKVDLGQQLSATTGFDVMIDNDVIALTKGLHWIGPASSYDRLAVITIGAGVGYGLIMHDEVVESPDTGIGMLSHVPLDRVGPRCWQGHRGCAAALLTLSAIATQASISLQRKVNFEEVLSAAIDGQPAAGGIIDDAAEALGRMIGTVASITMTNRVVLTGEAVEIAEVSADALNRGLKDARDPRAAELEVELVPHDFVRWAQGAAISAVLHWLGDLPARPH
jgi:predicted NBD/HSP70 family sugar kinase